MNEYWHGRHLIITGERDGITPAVPPSNEADEGGHDYTFTRCRDDRFQNNSPGCLIESKAR